MISFQAVKLDHFLIGHKKFNRIERG